MAARCAEVMLARAPEPDRTLVVLEKRDSYSQHVDDLSMPSQASDQQANECLWSNVGVRSPFLLLLVYSSRKGSQGALTLTTFACLSRTKNERGSSVESGLRVEVEGKR